MTSLPSGIRRQTVYKGSAVAFGIYAAVENYDHAAVLPGADQSAGTLPEFQNRFGQRIVEKGITALLFYPVTSGLSQRVSRHCKGQFGDNYITQTFAGIIHAGPEAVGTEQD